MVEEDPNDVGAKSMDEVIEEYPGEEDEFKPKSLDQLVGKVVAVMHFDVEESERYEKEVAVLEIVVEGEGYREKIRTGSQGIIKALKKYGIALPWKTRIVKDGNAFYFAKP